MILRTESLSKDFGTFRALDHLDMTIEEGSIVGFVGPNGAGKTTAMRIMTMLMRPTSGEVYFDEVPISKNVMESRRLIGFTPDYFGVYNSITSEEYLEYYAQLNKIPKYEIGQLVDDMLALVNLSEKKYTNVNVLSRGMKQRLCLARCLLHDPQTVILDEPAAGLDPQARAELKYILRALKDQGKSVLISSHILPELGEFCDKVVILSKGKKLAEGSIDEISRQMGGKAKISYELLRDEDFELAAMTAKSIDKTGTIIRDGMTLEIEFDGDEAESAELTKRLVLSGVMITGISKTKQTLEQVFLEVIDNDQAK